jgi:hypothetical protein
MHFVEHSYRLQQKENLPRRMNQHSDRGRQNPVSRSRIYEIVSAIQPMKACSEMLNNKAVHHRRINIHTEAIQPN